MKPLIYIILILFTVTSCSNKLQNNSHKHPQTGISNGILSASIYLPDADDGYYRATRFDWSGIISSLEYKGHTFFGKWFDRYSPTAHYSIMGPVDAFDPINYDETDRRGAFVKIGVGSLIKSNRKPYESRTTYSISNPGSWTIISDTGRIQFQHVLNDENYPYEYTKTIELIDGEAKMLISYNLKNTGEHSIETQVFNHNFFVFDDQDVGKDFVVTFSNSIKCVEKSSGIGTLAEIKDDKLAIIQSLSNGKSIYCGSLKNINDEFVDYDFSIESPNTGVRILGDQPLSRLAFWSKDNTICPEPYINITIRPGEEFSWEISYEFYTKN